MTQYIKNIQKLYQGCINTPNLWFNDALFGLEQMEINQASSAFKLAISQKLRLGKLVERLIGHQLNQDESIQLLAENVQVQDQKRTLGELDCLLHKDGKPIHLEIVYKFYLYDDSHGTTEIEHWIGPNRNDSLTKKLYKLKDKQLPLLYNQCTKTYLESLNLEITAIQQKVCFKAQLFLPFYKKDLPLKLINSSCVQGFYLRKNDVIMFKDYKFFIPEKLNWLIEPHANVTWKTYSFIIETITTLLNQKMAPMVWIKNSNGIITKIFIVWW